MNKSELAEAVGAAFGGNKTMGAAAVDAAFGAVSDALGLAAHPLPALERRDPERDVLALRRIIEDREVERIVVGLPLNMDGSEGAMSQEVRRFGAGLEVALGCPITYEDERLTTDEAESQLRFAGLRPSERRKLRDSLAAAVILRTVLERDDGAPGDAS